MARKTQQVWNLRLAAGRLVHRTLLRLGIDVAEITSGDKPKELSVVMNEGRITLNGFEACHVFMLARAAATKLEGDLAEVGVYLGGSAKLLAMAKGDKALHLFDTFAGLPKPGQFDPPTLFWESEFAADIEEVRTYLSDFPNVYLHKGEFPATASAVDDCRFCFVHLDVDLYEPMTAAVAFFYPRLVTGGLLLCHDYYASGVRKAVDEFFGARHELLLPQPAGHYCLIVKGC